MIDPNSAQIKKDLCEPASAAQQMLSYIKELIGTPSTVQVRYSKIPVFLREGAFYQSLCDDDSIIAIPTSCYAASDTVKNVQDLTLILEVLSYWIVQTIPDSVIKFCANSDFSTWAAAVNRAGDIARDLRTIFSGNPDNSLPYAIAIDRTEVVEYLVHHRAPSVRATIEAAKFGRLNYLQLLRQHNHPWDNRVILSAARDGHLDCIRYALEQGLEWHPDAGSKLVQLGDIELLKKACNMNCPLQAEMLAWAAYGGYLDCLAFLLSKRCPIELTATEYACQAGRVDSLQVLYETVPLYYDQAQVLCDEHTASTAAQYNKLECLQYLHTRSCPWGESTTFSAAVEGHTEVLRYVLFEGCPHNESIITHAASCKRSTSLACLKVLIDEQGLFLGEDGEAFAIAFGNANYECLRYLIDVGYASHSYSISAAVQWLTCLETHAALAMKDSDYLCRFDAKLLKCCELAYDLRWTFPRDGVNLIHDHFPMCKAFFVLESDVLLIS